MRINSHLAKTARPSSSGTLLPEPLFWGFRESHRTSWVTSNGACGDRCPCIGLFLNGHRIFRKTDKSSSKSLSKLRILNSTVGTKHRGVLDWILILAVE